MSAQTLRNQFTDNEYKNWLRACLGLKYVKEAIVSFIDSEVKALHASVVAITCGTGSCNTCTTEFITKRRALCPNNVCHLILNEIEQNHRFRGPCWKNSDATKWCTDHWEIGKCFMSQGYDKKYSAADTDCAGLVSVCINGKFLPATLMSQIVVTGRGAPPADVFHKVRELRNTLLHSATLAVTDADRKAYLLDMIALLRSYKPSVDSKTQDAIDKLDELNTTDIFIQETDELGILNEKFEACQRDVQQANCGIDVLNEKLEACQSDVQQAQSEIDALKAHVEASDDRQMEAQRKFDEHQENQESENSRLERLISDTAQSLTLLIGKLDKLVKTNSEDVKKMDEMKSKCESLHRENQSVYDLFSDLKSRIDTFENRQSCMEDQVQSHGKCIEHLEEEGSTYKLRIDHLEDQDRSKGDRISHLEDKRFQEQIDEIKELVCVEDSIKAADRAIVDKIRDIQMYLIKKYKRDESTVPMSPLLRRITANIQDVYIQLNIREDLVHSTARKRGESSRQGDISDMQDDYTPGHKQGYVCSYRGVLFDGQSPCRNIYVVGKAGVGKTTWSQKLSVTWARAMENQQTQNKTVLQEYDLVFYLALRYAKGDNTILEMIEHQLFPDDPHLFAAVTTILNDPDHSSRCLIVLDGLDEWTSPRHLSDGLPARDPRCEAVTVTTTRPWKLESLQLKAEKLDRAVEIHGLVGGGINTLVGHIVQALNTHTGLKKHICDFPSNLPPSVDKCMHVPLLLTILVCLWYENDSVGEQVTEIYSGLIQLLIKYAEGNTRTQLYQRLEPDKLQTLKETWRSEQSSVPERVRSKQFLVTYAPFLIHLGKLAFNALFSSNKESSLVFDDESVRDYLNEEELELAVKIGILSQTTYSRSVIEPKFTLSFLHKTIQEYLAALYMVSTHQANNTECLDVYKSFCSDQFRVLEMEMVLLFISGLDPEMAGYISRHIIHPVVESDKVSNGNQFVQRLLLRCVREEHCLPDSATHIYIKYHFLRYVEKGRIVDNEDKRDTLSYLRQAVDVDTVLSIEYDLLHFVNRRNHTEQQMRSSALDLRECKTIKVLKVDCFKEQILLPTEHLKEVRVHGYCRGSKTVLDLSGCNVLETLVCREFSAPIQLPATSVFLETVIMTGYTPFTPTVLDLSGCKALRRLEYRKSSAPIHLPVVSECLKTVIMIGCRFSTKTVLNLSGCKVLRTLVYRKSSAAIQVPAVSQCLKTVNMFGYTPTAVPVLDLSGCKMLRKLTYKASSVPIQLPAECLEKVVVIGYTPRTETVLDLSGCKVLRTLMYKKSSAPIQLSSTLENLKTMVLIGYTPRTETVLDLSGFKVLRTLVYRKSSIPLCLPSDCLEQVIIEGYTTSTVTALDLSECKVLRTLVYKESSVPIQYVAACLEKVAMIGYAPSIETVLDLSECKILRTLVYRNSCIPLCLSSACLEKVIMEGYAPSNVSVLDLSGCKVLRTLVYKESSVPIQFVVTCLEKVIMTGYTQSTGTVLDLSGCKALKTLEYRNSSVPLLVPSACLEVVIIEGYAPSTVSLLDLSGCKVLRTLVYKKSSVPIQIPVECLEKVVMIGYTPSTETVLDLSGCNLLSGLLYQRATVPVRVPAIHKVAKFPFDYLEKHKIVYNPFTLFSEKNKTITDDESKILKPN